MLIKKYIFCLLLLLFCFVFSTRCLNVCMPEEAHRYSHLLKPQSWKHGISGWGIKTFRLFCVFYYYYYFIVVLYSDYKDLQEAHAVCCCCLCGGLSLFCASHETKALKQGIWLITLRFPIKDVSISRWSSVSWGSARVILEKRDMYRTVFQSTFWGSFLLK